jgi:hypothetical protein
MLWRSIGLTSGPQRALIGIILAISFLLISQPSSPTERALPRANKVQVPSADLLVPPEKFFPLETIAAVEDSQFLTSAPFGPVKFERASADKDRAIDCLATAAWYEAGNDPSGQRAVIQVVLNRLRHPNFPKSICGVVFQGAERKTGCQFSFTCDGSMRRRFPAPASWSQARTLGESALNGAVDTDVRQATHFHADYVSPWWGPKLEQITKIGAHIFYRWPGSRGALSSGTSWIAKEADLPKPTGGTLRNSGGDAAMPAGLASRAGESPAPDLSGSVRLKLPPPSRAAFMHVEAAGPSGRWALAALERCSGRALCQIIAYGQPGQIERNRQLPGTTIDRPLFLFIRDSASGMDLALWDCDHVERSNAAQCLPTNQAELRALMSVGI